jgi:phage terminase large subunit-like protein
VKGPRSDLYEAIETATGAHGEILSVVISTQAPTDADLLSILIDDARDNDPPDVVLEFHTFDPDLEKSDKNPKGLDPFSIEALKLANPALGDFLNEEEVLRMAEDARRMPARENDFRNLVLNQRIETYSPFISKAVWKACDSPVIESWKGRKVWGGLDLSDVNDLTALVLVTMVDGVWHLRPTFWLPEQGLIDKAKADRVPYDIWRDQGFLLTTPGRTVEYEFVAEYMRSVFDECEVQSVAFDRWNFKHFKPWLVKAQFGENELSKWVEFGQGFMSQTPSLRTFESKILSRRIAHGGHPILTMCAANAVVERDPAGNRKLTKAKSRGRIDGMVAASNAFGVAGAYEGEKPFDAAAMIA